MDKFGNLTVVKKRREIRIHEIMYEFGEPKMLDLDPVNTVVP
jgi:hypothetical protein